MSACNWRAWYADGRRFDSSDTTIKELPAEGLVCVVEYLDYPYKNIYHGEYIWNRDGKWGTARAEFDAKVYGDHVFPGVLMPNGEWSELQDEAMGSTWP